MNGPALIRPVHQEFEAVSKLVRAELERWRPLELAEERRRRICNVVELPKREA